MQRGQGAKRIVETDFCAAWIGEGQGCLEKPSGCLRFAALRFASGNCCINPV
jgi:hypothetical protein